MASDILSILVGETWRKAGMVAKASGDAITSGTVNYYLKAKSGVNAGKWWKNSDQTWAVVETANAMTHDADGNWTIELAESPFADGVVYLEYAKESTNLHVAGEGRLLRGKAVDYGLASADTGATAVARTGADGDTLETLSDQLDVIAAALVSGYWCVVRHIVNDTDGSDLWTLIPMKDFASQASATAVVLTVKKRSDGSTLINAAACTQVGATAVWKYTATATSGAGGTNERINDGNECYDAVVTFTCDASSRTAPPIIVARDG